MSDKIFLASVFVLEKVPAEGIQLDPSHGGRTHGTPVPSSLNEHESSYSLSMSREKASSATVRCMMLAHSGSRAPMCGVSSPDN